MTSHGRVVAGRPGQQHRPDMVEVAVVGWGALDGDPPSWRLRAHASAGPAMPTVRGPVVKEAVTKYTQALEPDQDPISAASRSPVSAP